MSSQSSELSADADSTSFTWTDLGTPGVRLMAPAGSMAGGIPNVSALDSNGVLWSCWLGGSGWQWTSLGQPAGVPMAHALGTVSIEGSTYVLLLDGKGTLWACWLNGTTWQWDSLSPAPAHLLKGAGTSESGGQATVYALDNKSTLWQCSSASGWQWSSLGQPTGGDTGLAPMGTLMTYNGPSVLVRESPGLLWQGYLNQGAPAWSSLSQPADLQAAEAAGALLMGNQPRAFVLDAKGSLWTCWQDGAGWHWTSLGQPAGASLFMTLGTVKILTDYAVVLQDDKGVVWNCKYGAGPAWFWSSMGQAGNGGLVTPMGTLSTVNNAYVFGLDAFGNLWSCN